ncbi:MAG: HAD family phosphatase [Clostridiales bacterium]|nr:HAD family phosphatase [Clostridiales bacterium]
MLIDTIVSDMDDTLLGEDGQLSEYTIRVLRQCTQRGIRVIPASGRAMDSMRPYLQQLNTGCPAIGCNGAQLISPELTLMSCDEFTPELAREICAFMDAHGLYVQVYKDDYFYYAEECDPAKQYKKSSGMKGKAVGDLQAFLTFPTPKVLGITHPEEVIRILPIAEKQFAGRVAFSVSKPYFIEAEPPNVSKANGLKLLSQRMEIVPERTLVFGDSLNDLSMLAFTPNSVAMGNARPEVKAAAAYVCLTNAEDGVARFIEEHVLNAAKKEANT